MVTVNQLVEKLEQDLYMLFVPADLNEEIKEKLTSSFRRMKNNAIQHWKLTVYYVSMKGKMSNDAIYDTLDKIYPKKFVDYLEEMSSMKDAREFNVYKFDLIDMISSYRLIKDMEVVENNTVGYFIDMPPPIPRPIIAIDPVTGQPVIGIWWGP